MFEDIGKKIKGLALTVFWIETIGAFVTGMVLMLTSEYLILSGLFVMFLGPLCAWLSTLVLYAFGELVDKTSQNEENSRRILAILKNQKNSNPQPVTTTGSRPQIKPASNPVESFLAKPDKFSEEEPVEAAILDDQKICPVCGMVQKADRSVCWKCGQKFSN